MQKIKKSHIQTVHSDCENQITRRSSSSSSSRKNQENFNFDRRLVSWKILCSFVYIGNGINLISNVQFRHLRLLKHLSF